MKISVDPRTELLTIVQYMGQYDRIFNFPLIDRTSIEKTQEVGVSDKREQDLNEIYRKAIDSRFEKYKEHNAVAISDELANMGFAFDAPHFLIWQFSNPPQLKREAELPSLLFDKIENRSKLNSFVDALRDFSERSDFMGFFESQKKYYSYLENKFSEITGNLDFAEELHSYMNIPGAECSIVLSPLNMGNYGCHRQIGKKIYPVSILGMSSRLIENFLSKQKDRVAALCWHEFAHTYINPLSVKSSDLVNASSGLFPQVEAKMKKIAYPEWKIHINEMIIRALTNRLVRLRFGEDAYRGLLDQDREKGFIFIDEADKILAAFEKNGVLKPSIKECHREILLRLVEMSPAETEEELS